MRVHEKCGKQHEMPCHHNLDEYLPPYIDGAQLGGVLFRTALGRTGLSDRPMSQSDVYRLSRRRAGDADIATKIGCTPFRATGITE